ncbi:hypothetical protein Trydic_g8051 [Trypoxylus dichotomus]
MALVPSCVRFERGGLAEISYLTVSKLTWSAMILGTALTEDSTPAIIPLLGIFLGDRTKLSPLIRTSSSLSNRGLDDR